MTSLFRKILIAYLGITVIAFTFLTVAVHFEIRHFLAAQRLQVLRGEAEQLLPVLENVSGNPRLLPGYVAQVSRDRRQYGTTVSLVLMKQGRDLARIKKLNAQLVSHDAILTARLVKEVLAGKEIHIIGPFRPGDRQSTLVVGVPVVRSGEVIGALFLHTPTQQLATRQVTQIILLIAGPILLLSLVALFFVSRRFSRPLLAVNDAVQAVGYGDFSKRVEVTGDDEVGQLAAAFNEMTAKLERLERMRRDLIANVSHEIRTPLTSVRGFIQGIVDGVVPPAEQTEYLQTALSELERLNTVLNAMLDMSAIETGHVVLNLGPVRWQEVVSDVVRHTRIRADARGLRLVVTTGEDDAVVWGDRDRLIQVVFNLVDNAIRHTEDGEIQIRSLTKGNLLVVEVQDTGEGIPPHVLPRIWERFYSGLRSTADRSATQTGLGLTIVKHLVEMMNGRITVNSVPGVGSTFTLQFPLFSA